MIEARSSRLKRKSFEQALCALLAEYKAVSAEELEDALDHQSEGLRDEISNKNRQQNRVFSGR